MALFSKQNKEALTNPLSLDHPILVQVLGICSAPSVVTSHTSVPLSSSSIALLFAPIWYALAPFSPFTRTTCCAGCGIAAGYCGTAYGLIKGLP